MAVNGRVQVLNEVSITPEDDWRLSFQRVRYVYDDGTIEEGYRFIWRRPDNSLQGARGQARIPSLRIARLLMAEAEKAGWGHYDADNASGRFVESAVTAA
ncbi:MAG TPA: hypothetical protein VNW90_31790 [Acetobacteraceae bacterium]|jgi:hypothetical protein|nr:hypothetical protein [Acetobacteraceae bacterium]